VTASDHTRKRWKVIDLIEWTSNYFQDKGFENARLNAERLLAFTLDVDRVQLYLNFDRPLTPDELAEFKKLLQRRLAHEPLQYILGETEFMSLPFKVTPDVLIPRPETEILVEKTLEYCRTHFTEIETITLLDVGTGSGNIAVSLARYLQNARVVAVDQSAAALHIAGENAERNQVAEKIQFLHLDALSTQGWEQFRSFFDIIVANPPYIKAKEYQDLPEEIKKYEPVSALLAGEDGLDFYRNFAKIMANLLKPDAAAFFEIGADMAQSVREIFEQAGFTKIEIFQDLAGKDRVVKVGIH